MLIIYTAIGFELGDEFMFREIPKFTFVIISIAAIKYSTETLF